MDNEDALTIWKKYVQIINWHENLSKMDKEDLDKLSESITSTLPNADLPLIIEEVNTSIKAPRINRTHFPTSRTNFLSEYLDYILAVLIISLAILLIIKKRALQSSTRNIQN